MVCFLDSSNILYGGQTSSLLSAVVHQRRTKPPERPTTCATTASRGLNRVKVAGCTKCSRSGGRSDLKNSYSHGTLSRDYKAIFLGRKTNDSEGRCWISVVSVTHLSLLNCHLDRVRSSPKRSSSPLNASVFSKGNEVRGLLAFKMQRVCTKHSLKPNVRIDAWEVAKVVPNLKPEAGK